VPGPRVIRSTRREGVRPVQGFVHLRLSPKTPAFEPSLLRGAPTHERRRASACGFAPVRGQWGAGVRCRRAIFPIAREANAAPRICPSGQPGQPRGSLTSGRRGERRAATSRALGCAGAAVDVARLRTDRRSIGG
jgi:hypothetical protein